MTQAQIEPDVLHAEAVKALLAPIGYPVYLDENEIPDQPHPITGWPYLCAWSFPGDPIPGDSRIAGYSGSILTRHQITIAALSRLDVIGAAARVRNALERKRPTISGRRCGDMAQEPGPTTVPTVDPTVRGPQGQLIYVAFCRYSLTSSPIRT